MHEAGARIGLLAQRDDQTPLAIDPLDLDALDDRSHRRRPPDSVHHRLARIRRRTNDVREKRERVREAVGRGQLPEHARLDLLSDRERARRLGSRRAEVVEVDRAVEEAEQLDVETGRDDSRHERIDQQARQHPARGRRVRQQAGADVRRLERDSARPPVAGELDDLARHDLSAVQSSLCMISVAAFGTKRTVECCLRIRKADERGDGSDAKIEHVAVVLDALHRRREDVARHEVRLDRRLVDLGWIDRELDPSRRDQLVVRPTRHRLARRIRRAQRGDDGAKQLTGLE